MELNQRVEPSKIRASWQLAEDINKEMSLHAISQGIKSYQCRSRRTGQKFITMAELMELARWRGAVISTGE
jgi:hypothetical protein